MNVLPRVLARRELRHPKAGGYERSRPPTILNTGRRRSHDEPRVAVPPCMPLDTTWADCGVGFEPTIFRL